MRRLAAFVRHASKCFLVDHCLISASALSHEMLPSLSSSACHDMFASRAEARPLMVERTTKAWFTSASCSAPRVLAIVAITALYCLIPTCLVRKRNGIAAALIAVKSLKTTKLAFVFDVSQQSFYNTIYDALAQTPVILL